MFLDAFWPISRARKWSEAAPRWEGEYCFGPESPERVVLGVFGDSVGCGLGVTKIERTFAGGVALRLARERRVLCRINAVSGARSRELAEQGPAGDERFAVVSIGTNDIIHGEKPSALEGALSSFLESL
ncbi:MAG: hypothetical protein HY925_09255, partial [Elusimicrobia bacterium]|nr:hypothetical protein [Elusimicrobiota bacterium]